MMQMVNLTIDGKQIQAPAGSSVLEAARSAGIYIPTLCYHPDLRPEKPAVHALWLLPAYIP